MNHASKPKELEVSTSYSEIIPGLLYMGGMSSFHCMALDDLPYDRWFQCSLEFYDDEHMEGRINIPLTDSHLPESEMILAEGTAAHAAHLIHRGNSVLISCTEGRNRSGLVTALTLLNLGHEDPVAILREKRHPSVLTNEAFENYLRERPVR